MGLSLSQSSSLALLIAALLSIASLVAAQQDVKFVKTAEDFQEAVTLGIRHIVIQRHLDLRTLPAAPAAEVPGARLLITSKTKSIRGDCTGIQPTGFTLDPRATAIGQCVLTVNSPVIELSSINSELLLSDVYIRLARTAAEMESFVPLITVKGGSVWVTTSVFRGDRTKCRAVDIHRNQKFHAHQAYFVGFEAEDSAAVRVSPGARGGFKQCTFNTNAAALHGSSVGMDSGSETDLPAACWFQSCIFSSNTDRLGYAVSQTDRRALHFNNRDFQKSVDAENGVLVVPDPLNFDEISALGFLVQHSTAETYQQIASEQAQLTDLEPVDIEGLDDAPPASTESGGSKIGPIVGGVAGAVVVTAGAIAAFFVLRQRRRHQLNDKYLPEPAHPDGGDFKQIMSSNTGSSLGASGRRPPWEDCKHTRERSLASSESFGNKPYSCGTSIASDNTRSPHFQGLTAGHSHITREQITRDLQRSQLALDKALTNRSAVTRSTSTNIANSMSRKMDSEHLEEALDDIHESRILFLGRFELHSQVHRRVGGQGIVQPARGRYDEEEYAIKFFLNRASFEREEALYLREDLRKMMPAVKDIVPNSDGTIVDTAGRVFPPAIVIERGEPLDEWALRIEPDFPTILTVLCHILARLQQLHSAGIAHRDIKPGNVLWRPKHHSWTLIDFGCAAEIGQTCPLSLSLLYAAPEAVQALEAGQRNVIADPASDMWALGVISFELLTASRVFARSMNADHVRDAIAGRAALPWETHDLKKKNVPELRMLRRSVLSCLNRNPQSRPTSTALLQQWNGLFDHATKGAVTEEVGQDRPVDR